MTAGARDTSLEAMLVQLQQATARQDLDLAGLFDLMNSRGLPAVMLVPTLLMLMPFGFFPGSNALIGLAMAFVAAQIALGRRRVWLPGWMARWRLSGRLIGKGLARLLPAARWLDARTGRRLGALAEGPLAERLAGLAMLALSLLAALAGLVPGIPTLVSAVVLLLAFGLLLRDGVVMALGYAAIGAVVWAAVALWA